MPGHEFPQGHTGLRQRRIEGIPPAVPSPDSSGAPALDRLEAQEPKEPRTLYGATKEFFGRWHPTICTIIGSAQATSAYYTWGESTPIDRALLGIASVSFLIAGIGGAHEINTKRELFEDKYFGLQDHFTKVKSDVSKLAEEYSLIRVEQSRQDVVYSRMAVAQERISDDQSTISTRQEEMNQRVTIAVDPPPAYEPSSD